MEKLSKDNHGFFPVEKNIQYFSLHVLGALYVRQKLLSFNFSTVLSQKRNNYLDVPPFIRNKYLNGE